MSLYLPGVLDPGRHCELCHQRRVFEELVRRRLVPKRFHRLVRLGKVCEGQWELGSSSCREIHHSDMATLC